MLVKIKLDGVEVEVDAGVAALAQRNEEKHAAALAAEKLRADAAEAAKTEVSADRDAQKARADAADAKIAQLTTDHAAALAAEGDKVRQRVALEDMARYVLGKDVKFDAADGMPKNDRAVRMDVLGKLCPTQKFDAESDEYVRARCDLAVEAERGRTDKTQTLRVDTAGTTGTTETEADKARRERLDADRDAWKKPLSCTSEAK